MTEIDTELRSMNTARDFALARISEWYGADAKYVSEDHKNPEAALRWFCAYREASQLLDSNSVKDWAHVLLDGIGPMNPEAEAETFFDCLDDDEELIEGWREFLLEVLDNFFGISAYKKKQEAAK